MRILIMALLMIPLAIGCGGDGDEKASADADADADAPIDDLIVLCVNALRVMARLPCVCAKNKQEIFWFAPSGWVTGRWYVRSSREFVF